MPEGDTIHHAAKRVRAALVGRRITAIETPQERHRRDRWPQRLAGREVRSVDAHGKHLFLRFDGELTLHSHLGMGGKWSVYRRGREAPSTEGRLPSLPRSPSRAWLVIRTDEHEVMQFDGPVLELMTESRTRFDQRLAALGSDLLRDDFDEQAFIRRLREDDPTRGIGDALLDQRNVAGIGNIWKSEGCHLAGVDPWRPVAAVSDGEARAVVRAARPLMRLSAERGGRTVTFEPERPVRGPESRTMVYGRAGLPCRRCGTPVRARGQGDDNRTTFWCPGCQR